MDKEDMGASDGLSSAGSNPQAVSPVPASIPDAEAGEWRKVLLTPEGYFSENGAPWQCANGFRAPYGSSEWLEDLDAALADAEALEKYPYGTRIESDEQHDDVIRAYRGQKAILRDAASIIYALRRMLAQGMAARSGETGTGSTEGNSPVACDAPDTPQSKDT